MSSTDNINVAFIGNPNCGKTTLFNAYTGARLKVANWPGVTVEKKEGAMRYREYTYKLVDLPGIYSLTSYTMEEKLSREYILGDEVDVIIDIADASSLERNLYLTLQLIELGKPIILALNMMDIVQGRGMEIDLHRLTEMLGIPVIPISARKGTGLEILMHSVEHYKDDKEHKITEYNHLPGQCAHAYHSKCVMVYSDKIEYKIDAISKRLKSKYLDIKDYRWYSIKLLEKDAEIEKNINIDFSDVIDRSYETDIINEKYNFIEKVIAEVLVNKQEQSHMTDKIDSILTHSIWGIPVFLGIMALVFFFTFTIGDAIKGVFEVGLEQFSGMAASFMEQNNVNSTLASLVIDGIIAGVGGILTFLPNIVILFFALAILEDSGYMARVAYVMDGIMNNMGLSGRAFIPMLLGFGCTVPAVMASRTLEDSHDRFKTILITPFMSCSARLPIYVLFSSMFFPNHALIVSYSMYVIGLVTAIVIALVINLFDKKKSMENNLLIELPEYKSPNAKTIFIYVWEKVKDYLSKAGTTIFIASVVLWFVLNFNMSGKVDDMSQSFGAMIAKWLVSIFTPIGLGVWQVVVALISGIAAKEVVVSSMGVLFGVVNISSENGMSQMVQYLAAEGFGPVNAYALMVFCLLYVPCIAAIATIKKEVNSFTKTAGMVVFQFAVAWLGAFLVYHIGRMFF